MGNNNRLSWGYLAGIISGITYGMNPLFGVPVINKGLDVNSLLFYRYGVATVLMLVFMLLAKKQVRITWKQFGLMTIVGILFTACSLTLFESYKYIPSGIATSILYVYPIMVALIMVFLGQKPSWQTWISIFAGVAGAVLLSLKGEGGFIDWRGIALVVASGLCYTLVYCHRQPEQANQGFAESYVDLLLLLHRFGDAVLPLGLRIGTQRCPRHFMLAQYTRSGSAAYHNRHHHFGGGYQIGGCHQDFHPRHLGAFDGHLHRYGGVSRSLHAQCGYRSGAHLVLHFVYDFDGKVVLAPIFFEVGLAPFQNYAYF